MEDKEVVELLNNRFDAVEQRFDGIDAKIQEFKSWRCEKVIKLETIQAEHEKSDKRLNALTVIFITIITGIAGFLWQK